MYIPAIQKEIERDYAVHLDPNDTEMAYLEAYDETMAGLRGDPDPMYLPLRFSENGFSQGDTNDRGIVRAFEHFNLAIPTDVSDLPSNKAVALVYATLDADGDSTADYPEDAATLMDHMRSAVLQELDERFEASYRWRLEELAEIANSGNGDASEEESAIG